MMLNMKIVNTFIPLVHFQIETLASILPTIERMEWAVSLDLKDAYFSCPDPSPSGFCLQGRNLQVVL